MGARGDWSDDLGDLRIFAEAVVVADDPAAGRALAERLVPQAAFARMAWPMGAALSPRARMFREFLRLHRKYLRRTPGEPARARSLEGDARSRGVETTVKGLPLEEREALLLVVLAGFGHPDAARVLEISLALLRDRLLSARDALSVDPAVSPSTAARAAHLRVVK